MSSKVRIVEMGPRDGLQNEKQPVATETKLELIHRLARAGLKDIEATAFVSPKWVPQMADHLAVMAGLKSMTGVNLPVLTPNIKGFEAAAAAGAREVAVFASASEAFSQRNINCSVAESLERFEPILAMASKMGIRVRGYVSCAVACPYDGPIEPEQVAQVAADMLDMGCYEISVADTIGVGTPRSVVRMLEHVARRVPVEQLAGHYHDTFGMGVVNVHASYQFGLRIFDSSIAGLGGCPYAKGATGNVATEDVVYLLHGIGADTGTDLDALVEVGEWISQSLDRRSSSSVGRAFIARRAVSGNA